MIVVLSLTILGLLAVLVIAYHLERAPEAFQDEHGFHILANSGGTAGRSAPSPLANPGEVIG